MRGADDAGRPALQLRQLSKNGPRGENRTVRREAGGGGRRRALSRPSSPPGRPPAMQRDRQGAEREHRPGLGLGHRRGDRRDRTDGVDVGADVPPLPWPPSFVSSVSLTKRNWSMIPKPKLSMSMPGSSRTPCRRRIELTPSLLIATKVSSTSGPTSKIQRSKAALPLPVRRLSTNSTISVPPSPSETKEQVAVLAQLLTPA